MYSDVLGLLCGPGEALGIEKAELLISNPQVHGLSHPKLAVHVEGMVPGDRIKLGDEEIVIGLSGTYSVNTPALAISLANTNSGLGQVTYEYALPADQFDKISKIRYEARLKTLKSEHDGVGAWTEYHNKDLNILKYKAPDSNVKRYGTLPEAPNEELVEIYNLYFEYQPGPDDTEETAQSYSVVITQCGTEDQGLQIYLSETGPSYALPILPYTVIKAGLRVNITAYYLVKIIE